VGDEGLLGGLAEESQPGLAIDLTFDRPEHLHRDALFGQKGEGLVVAHGEAFELDRPALAKALERALPRSEWLVHLVVGNGEEVSLEAGDHGLVTEFPRGSELIGLPHARGTLDKPVVKDPPGMDEESLARLVVRL
jgi:hypothetical protein